MKTGNKILIIFISSIAFIMLLGAVNIRYFSHSNGNSGRNDLKYKDYAVGNFSYIKVVGEMGVSVKVSDSSKIRISGEEHSKTPEINFAIHHDTLMVIKKSHDDFNSNVEIYTAKLPSGISAVKANIVLYTINTGKLKIDLDDSRISDMYGESGENKRINNLFVSLKNESKMDFNSFKIDTLILFSNNSESRFEDIKKLQAELKNNSDLRTGNIDDIHLIKDNNCHVHIVGNQ